MSRLRVDEEVFRLILMEEPGIRIKRLRDRIREEQPLPDNKPIDLYHFMQLIRKYIGNRDRGTPPTHDVETGERL